MKVFVLQANKNVMFKANTTSVLCLFTLVALDGGYLFAGGFLVGWVLLSSVKGMSGRISSGPTEEDLKI